MAKKLPRSPLAPQSMPIMPTIQGIKLAVAQAQESYKGRDDVLLLLADQACSTAAVFTTNAIAGAPVQWSRSHMPRGAHRALLVNAGNANVMTGEAGLQAVNEVASSLARELGCRSEEILASSTGVIGKQLNTPALIAVLPELIEKTAQADADAYQWERAAQAIMTTDTFAKYATVKTQIDDNPVTINAIAKGSGMIEPNMATMLCFIATDAAIEPHELHLLLRDAVDQSFNALTVDADTSTSDMVVMFATGAAKNRPISFAGDFKRLGAFQEALNKLTQELAILIARDGEGAQKLITVHVEGASNDAQAKLCAKSIANSMLVKTAIAGEDANWGRVAMAIGKSGVDFNPNQLKISFGKHVMAEYGCAHAFDEAVLKRYLQGQEIDIYVQLAAGKARSRVWTCDLTHAYIDINADYRS